MIRSAVKEIVQDYLSVFPDESEGLRPLIERLQRDEQFNHRKSFDGHGTGAAIVISPDHKKVLMVNHKILGKWFQPGGHWDPEDPNPWTVAQREAEEETGVEIAKALHIDMDRPHIPLEINTHLIPENPKKEEPAHYHYDFRYAFVAASEAVVPLEAEVTDIAWIDIDSEDPRLVEIWACLVKLQQFKLV